MYTLSYPAIKLILNISVYIKYRGKASKLTLGRKTYVYMYVCTMECNIGTNITIITTYVCLYVRRYPGTNLVTKEG